MNRFLATVFACILITSPRALGKPVPVESVRKDAGGLTLRMRTGLMRVRVCTDEIIHIVYTPGASIPKQVVPVVNRVWTPVQFTVSDGKKTVALKTRDLEVLVDRNSGAVGFYTANGTPILQEPPDGGKTMTPANVAGEKTFHPEQVFLSPPGESFYGLGQFPEGLMDWRGIPLRLQEVNTQIALPMLLS
ncbi:MAG: DUF4968 domain-containing protein, partial [Terriglobia bacterium]